MATSKLPIWLTYSKLRAIAFHVHRWLGLIAGILLCIVGVTGSLLVFRQEIDRAVITASFGRVNPAGEFLPVGAIVAAVEAAYRGKNLTLGSLDFPDRADRPYTASFSDAAGHYFHAFINPYTGQIMGDRQWETSLSGIILNLHYKLLAGDTGILIVGIVALITVILSVTGIVLWPGWRKLAAGFKIKWDAHIKRLNFDLHKVAGIIAAIFLALTGFTGFAWNIPQAKVTDIVYAVTLTAKPVDPVSVPIAGKQPLAIDDLMQRGNAVIPNMKTTYIDLANEPEAPFVIGKKHDRETDKYGTTRIYLDRFSGKVIQLHNGIKPSRAEAILNQFSPVHFGTFGGLSTRILYVFVGLAPLILFITGFIMWWYRRKRVMG